MARLSEELAQVGEDRAARARINRDLRYWTARRANAQLVAPPQTHELVRFGSTVTLDRDDGRTHTFRIVGEDEADIKAGKISINSPIARALIGKFAGDIAEVQAPGGVREYEIIAVRYE